MAVEYLYGDTNLCNLEVHSIFAILARGVLRTQSNIYDGVFCKRLNAVNCFCKISTIDVQLGSKYVSVGFYAICTEMGL